MTTERTLGQVAYEAWANAMGWKPSHWDRWPTRDHDAWEAAAKAVVQKVFHDNPPETRGAEKLRQGIWEDVVLLWTTGDRDLQVLNRIDRQLAKLAQIAVGHK